MKHLAHAFVRVTLEVVNPKKEYDIMSLFHRSFTGTTLFVALLVSSASAFAQVQVRVGGPSTLIEANPTAVEAAIYLELYGHPDTARRYLEVRVTRDRVELTGLLAGESERLTARRIVAEVAPELTLHDHMTVRDNGPFPKTRSAGSDSPSELKRRNTDLLASKFPPEVLRELTLTVYRVDLPIPGERQVQVESRWVLVLEGLAPSIRDQLALSELLFFDSTSIAAVINRTYVADGYVPEYKPKVRVRVPFVDVDVGNDNGVEVHVGPLVVRTVGKYRAGNDSNLIDGYMNAVRADDSLQEARLHSHIQSGVLTIEGALKAADKMRAVALAYQMSNIRGVVDRSEVIVGKPAYYHIDDLEAYLHYRLGEHAGAREFELTPMTNHRFKLQATVPTAFHAAMAMVVIEDDPVLSQLFVEPSFRDATSGTVLSMRR